MRLKFNILCFEDNPKNLKPVIKGVENHLEESGFELKIVGFYENNDELDKIIEDIKAGRKDVDLILMDNKLTKDQKGSTLINSIRDCKLYTDIIFYTQKGDLKEEIGFLEGIYLAGRDTLQEKTIMVIDNLLKKTLDLSNFRGLVMAETSELDELIHQIILTFLEGDFFNDPVKEKESIKKRVCENLDGRRKKLDKIKFDEGSPGDTRKFISDLESSLKARTLQDLTGKFIENAKKDSITSSKYRDIAEKLTNNRFVSDSYLKEVQGDRNKLGHLKESTDENGKKILKPTREGEDAFEFDEKKALEIRKNLKKYLKILNGIYETISGKKWD